jgi:hypothetical protein
MLPFVASADLLYEHLKSYSNQLNYIYILKNFADFKSQNLRVLMSRCLEDFLSSKPETVHIQYSTIGTMTGDYDITMPIYGRRPHLQIIGFSVYGSNVKDRQEDTEKIHT